MLSAERLEQLEQVRRDILATSTREPDLGPGNLKQAASNAVDALRTVGGALDGAAEAEDDLTADAMYRLGHATSALAHIDSAIDELSHLARHYAPEYSRNGSHH